MDIEARIPVLVARFDGLIKYRPMLQDHPDWTDDECVEFAVTHHERAVEQYLRDPATWNSGVPYCRNVWREDLA